MNALVTGWRTYRSVCSSIVRFSVLMLCHAENKLSLVLQTLNGLCTAGTKLAQSLQALLSVHDTVAQCRLTSQCLAGWEELTRATHIASNTVKNHVITAMRDHESRDNDGDRNVSNLYSVRLSLHWGIRIIIDRYFRIFRIFLEKISWRS